MINTKRIQRKITVKGVDHVAVVVTDLERALAFYRDLLGLKQIPRPESDLKGAYLVCPDGVTIPLLVAKDVVDTTSIRHIGLAVENRAEAIEILKEHGVRIVRAEPFPPRPGHKAINSSMVLDPDGNKVEIREVR